MPSDTDRAGAPPTEIPESSGTTPDSPNTRKRDLRFVLVLATLLATLALLLFVRNVGGTRGTADAANIKSIAVLPFENLSGNPAEQYFADGMTDELITELARSKGLRVISRTSVMQYKGVHRPVRDIARALGVDGILEGSVLEDHGRMRVTVQLVHAPSDTQVWARSYIRDSNDLLLLQQDLAENVAKEVDRAALPAKLSTQSISPAAHDAYLRGRFNWFKANNETARDYFEKAIQLQPDYAAAYSGLADYYIGGATEGILVPQDALPKGEAIARKALQLEDSSAVAHNSMAALYLFYLWNWTAAEKESKTAIELNPNFAEAYHVYAYLLLTLGRRDEAVDAERKSQELDPFARPSSLGYVLSCASRYQEAENELRLKADALPTDSDLHFQLSQLYLAQGKEKESMNQFSEMLRLEGDEELAAQVRAAYAGNGNRGVQEWRLEHIEQLVELWRSGDVKKMAQKTYVAPMEMAIAHARLGQDDQAMRWLSKAYETHDPGLIRLQWELDLNGLHHDARYQALVKRMGLPSAY